MVTMGICAFAFSCSYYLYWSLGQHCPELAAPVSHCVAAMSSLNVAACHHRLANSRPQTAAAGSTEVLRVWQTGDCIFVESNTTACPSPHYMARAVGASLNLLVSVSAPDVVGINVTNGVTTLTPSTPLRGAYIIDILLTTCAAFRGGVDEEVDPQRCLFRPPRRVHRDNHVFKGTSGRDGDGSHRKCAAAAPETAIRAAELQEKGLRDHSMWGSPWKLCVPALLTTDLVDTRFQTQACLAWRLQGRSLRESQCAGSIMQAYHHTRMSPPRRTDTLSTRRQYCLVGASHARGLGMALARVLGTTAALQQCFHCLPNHKHAEHCGWRIDAVSDNASALVMACTTKNWSVLELEHDLGGEISDWSTYSRDDEANEVRILSALFARDVANVLAYDGIADCTHIVVHVGQWDLGWPMSRATSPSAFRSHLLAGLRTLSTASATVVLLSNNYNPLGASVLACPPTDWRMPDVVEAYNAIGKEVAETLGILFVDNNKEAIGPVWDSAEDWAHYYGAGFEAAAINLLWSLR